MKYTLFLTILGFATLSYAGTIELQAGQQWTLDANEANTIVCKSKSPCSIDEEIKYKTDENGNLISGSTQSLGYYVKYTSENGVSGRLSDEYFANIKDAVIEMKRFASICQ